MLFLKQSSRTVDKYQQNTILQLNVERLTKSKIDAIEQYAYRKRAQIVLL